MPNYEDPPEDYLCPICREEECEGCPGAERWFDEPDSIWTEPEPDLTREDYAIIEDDIFAEREEEERNGH